MTSEQIRSMTLGQISDEEEMRLFMCAQLQSIARSLVTLVDTLKNGRIDVTTDG